MAKGMPFFSAAVRPSCRYCATRSFAGGALTGSSGGRAAAGIVQVASAAASIKARSVLIHLQCRDEGFLGNFHLAELAHLLLPLLLLVEQLALARNVAAIAFRGHVLAHGRERLARHDLAA